jgi:hypothetical protein
LEAEGIEFIDDGGVPGVRLHPKGGKAKRDHLGCVMPGSYSAWRVLADRNFAAPKALGMVPGT